MTPTGVLAQSAQAAVGDPAIGWDRFRGATVLVTGATGTIGTALARALSAADAARGLGLTLTLHGRDIGRGERLAAALGGRFISGDVRELAPARTELAGLDYVFHGAGVTASAQMVSEPDVVIATAVEGTRAVLDLARELGARGVVGLSSMEVYGAGLTGVVSESEVGTLDLSDPRSSYPRAKRAAEALATEYGAAHGLRTTHARLALTFGAGVRNDPANTRVPLQFARAVLAGRDIELHTDGAGVTDVCDLGDAVRALLLLATEGEAGEAYNVANPQASMTIREMAEVVARDVAGGAIDVVVRTPEDIASRGYAPPSSHRLATEKIAALGWEPRHGMADMYRRMLAGWRS